MPDMMTVREVAAYLRIKERKVYDLVRQHRIPASRVTGKWLFSRPEIDRWLAQHSQAPDDAPAAAADATPPAVIAGSHDPLLDWAIREAECGLAILPGGSADGLRRLAAGAALAAGTHLIDDDGGYGLQAADRLLDGPYVALEWAWRSQGLVVAPGNPRDLAGVADLARPGVRAVARQADSGAQRLLAHLLAAAGGAPDAVDWLPAPARSETDVGLAVLEGRADAGLAIAAVARAHRLDFIPLARERFDVVLRPGDFFDPPLQALFGFARTPALARRADELGGYDVSGLGTVRRNRR